jgi:hypothetical protein
MAESALRISFFGEKGLQYPVTELQAERVNARKGGPRFTGLELLVILYPFRETVKIKDILRLAENEQADLKKRYVDAVYNCRASSGNDKNALDACLDNQGVTQLMLSFMLYKNILEHKTELDNEYVRQNAARVLDVEDFANMVKPFTIPPRRRVPPTPSSAKRYPLPTSSATDYVPASQREAYWTPEDLQNVQKLLEYFTGLQAYGVVAFSPAARESFDRYIHMWDRTTYKVVNAKRSANANVSDLESQRRVCAYWVSFMSTISGYLGEPDPEAVTKSFAGSLDLGLSDELKTDLARDLTYLCYTFPKNEMAALPNVDYMTWWIGLYSTVLYGDFALYRQYAAVVGAALTNWQQYHPFVVRMQTLYDGLGFENGGIGFFLRKLFIDSTTLTEGSLIRMAEINEGSTMFLSYEQWTKKMGLQIPQDQYRNRYLMYWLLLHVFPLYAKYYLPYDMTKYIVTVLKQVVAEDPRNNVKRQNLLFDRVLWPTNKAMEKKLESDECNAVYALTQLVNDVGMSNATDEVTHTKSALNQLVALTHENCLRPFGAV